MPEELNNELKSLEEICVTPNKIFDGKILNLRCDEVRTPSGHLAKREVVEHKSAIGVLALTGNQSVLLVKQYRYAINSITLEICAGLIEKGEDPYQAAEREMQEELKFKAGKLEKIGGFYASPGFCTEYVTIFLATELEKSSLPQDEDENVSTVEIKYNQIPAMLANGDIQDSKTFAALSWLMAKEGIAPAG